MSKENNSDTSRIVAIVGGVLAAVLSFKLNNGPIWMAIHFLFGWLYVLYLCCGFGGGLPEGSFW